MTEVQTKNVVDNHADKIAFHSLRSFQAILSAGTNNGAYRLYRWTAARSVPLRFTPQAADQRLDNKLSEPVPLSAIADNLRSEARAAFVRRYK